MFHHKKNSDWYQTDKWREFNKQCSLKICKSKGIARIYGVSYNPQYQGAIEVLNRTIQNFLTSWKTTKRKNII